MENLSNFFLQRNEAVKTLYWPTSHPKEYVSFVLKGGNV